VFAEWRAGMTALARHDNVNVKLGNAAGQTGKRAARPGCAAALVGGDREGVAAVRRGLRRAIRRASMHVREQLPGAEALVQLCGFLECVQAPGGSADEKAALFGKTAAGVYRLPRAFTLSEV